MDKVHTFNQLKAYPKVLELTEKTKLLVHELMDNGVVLTGDPTELVAAVVMAFGLHAQSEKAVFEPVTFQMAA